MQPVNQTDMRRFFSKVSVVPTAKGCLEWQARALKSGYGQFSQNGKSVYAHRMAYFLATGNEPGGLSVCHKCDNPLCVNPEHLFLGSVADNARDRDNKGRAACGEKNGSAKLNSGDVLRIRSDTRRQNDIAAHYGVSQFTISRIKAGKVWRHVK